jgi:hypothetical protein
MQIYTRHKRFCQTRLHHTHRSIPPVTPILYLDEPPAATDGSSGIQRNVVPATSLCQFVIRLLQQAAHGFVKQCFSDSL